jgi:hypothetical protein
MKRAKLNYVVDALIAGAFLICAVSGIVFLLPDSLVGVSNGQGSVLGISLPTWNTLHEWSALAMIAGVVLHTVLHARWIAVMTRRIFGSRAPEVASGRRAAPVHTRPAQIDVRPADPRVAVRTQHAPQDPAPTQTVHRYTSAQRDEQQGPGEPRINRRAFLAGAAGLGVAAVAGGVIGGRLLKGSGATQTTSSSSGSGAEAQARPTSTARTKPPRTTRPLPAAPVRRTPAIRARCPLPAWSWTRTPVPDAAPVCRCARRGCSPSATARRARPSQTRAGSATAASAAARRRPSPSTHRPGSPTCRPSAPATLGTLSVLSRGFLLHGTSLGG